MQYIDVSWIHKNPQDPVRLVSELDGQRYETRKLEFFINGTVGFASKDRARYGTELGVEPVPSLPEINTDSQFKGAEIEQTEFESLWQLHANRNA